MYKRIKKTPALNNNSNNNKVANQFKKFKNQSSLAIIILFNNNCKIKIKIQSNKLIILP